MSPPAAACPTADDKDGMRWKEEKDIEGKQRIFQPRFISFPPWEVGSGMGTLEQYGHEGASVSFVPLPTAA